VLVNGKPDTKRYKKYRIKTLKTGVIDDFASMEEILTRRTLAALRGEDPWPDLIIIDGGKGQLSSAVQAIQNAKSKMQNEGNSRETPFLKGDVRLGGQGDFKNPQSSINSDSSFPKELNKSSASSVGTSFKKEASDMPRIISLAKREEEVFIP